MGNQAYKVHNIINAERGKRGLPHISWSKYWAELAQSQANHCAKVGRRVHSDRPAFCGGENICGGKGYFSPRAIVNSWLKSELHRVYLLSPDVARAGVGIARRNGKMFATWTFGRSISEGWGGQAWFILGLIIVAGIVVWYLVQ